MKYPIIVIISILSFSTSFITAQCGSPENLIHNCGFEIMHPNAPNDAPNDFSQVHTNKEIYLTEWRSRAHIYNNPCLSGCSFNNVNIPAGHTPDLYSDINFNHVEGGAFSGNNFIGMSDYELIQQKFHKNKKIKDEQPYILRMTIKLASRSPGGSQALNWEGSDLNVYLSKKKIEYKEEKKCEKNCDEDYRTHKKSNDILNLFSITNLNWDMYSLEGGLNGWHAIELPISASNMSKYNWIAFELTNNLVLNESCFPARGCHQNYLLLDEISLVPACTIGCEIACSRTDGPLKPTANNLVDSTQPFRITGLESATNAFLEIYPETGQYPVYSQLFQSENGIGEILWDGTNFNGALLAPAIYKWKLSDVKNDCGFICNFENRVNVQGRPTIDSFERENSSLIIPEPCCEEEPDIFIDNVTISGPNHLEWKAVNSINIATKNNSPVLVKKDADIIFRAGNKIDIGPGFDFEEGAIIDFIIGNCEGNN